MSWLTKLGQKAYPAAQRFLSRRPPPTTTPPPPPPLINPDGSPLTLLNPTRRQFLQGTGAVANQVLNPLNAPGALSAITKTLEHSRRPRPFGLITRDENPLDTLLYGTEARALASDADLGKYGGMRAMHNLMNRNMEPPSFSMPLPMSMIEKANRAAKKIPSGGDDMSHQDLTREAIRYVDDPEELESILHVLENNRQSLLRQQDYDPTRIKELSRRAYPDITPETIKKYQQRKDFGVIGEEGDLNRVNADDLMKLSDSDLLMNKHEIHEGLLYEQLESPMVEDLVRRISKLDPGLLSDNLKKAYGLKPFTKADVYSRSIDAAGRIINSPETPLKIRSMATARRQLQKGELPGVLRDLNLDTQDLLHLEPKEWEILFKHPEMTKALATSQTKGIQSQEAALVQALKDIPMQESARSRINETLNDFLGLTTLNLTAKVTKATFNKLARQLERSTKEALPTVQDLIPLEYKPMIDDLIKVRKEAQKDLLEIRQQLPTP